MGWAMADKDKKKLKVILKLPKSSSQQKSSPAAAAAVANSSSGFALSAPPTSSHRIAPAQQDHRSKNVQQARHGHGGAAASSSALPLPHPHKNTAASLSFASVRSSSHSSSGWATSAAASAPPPASSQPAPTPPKKRKFKTVENAGALGVGAIVVGAASPAVVSVGPGFKKDAGRATGGGGGASASPAPIVPPAKKSHKKQVKPFVQADGPQAHPFAGVILQPQASAESLPKPLLEGVLDKLQKKDTYGVFAEPVDAAQVPDYYDIIKEPMDFGTMRKKIKKGSYTTVDVFEGDIYLICSNAMRYNGPETIYYKQARAIRDMARKALEGVRAEIAGEARKPVSHKKKPPPPKKSHSKKPTPNKVRFDGDGSDFASGATLAGNGEPRGWSNSTVDTGKAKKGISIGKLVGNGEESEGARAVPPVVAESKAEAQEEPAAGTALKPMGPKDGRRPLSTEEYHRNTYKQRLLPAHGQGPPLAAVGGESRQLVPVGSQVEHAYARSLAQFGAEFGPSAWRFVARKLQKVHAPVVQPSISNASLTGKVTAALPGKPGGAIRSDLPTVSQPEIDVGRNGAPTSSLGASDVGQVEFATSKAASGVSHVGKAGVPPSSHTPGASHVGQAGIPTSSLTPGASHVGQAVVPPSSHTPGASHVGQVGVPTSSHPSGASHVGQVGVRTSSHTSGASRPGQVAGSTSSHTSGASHLGQVGVPSSSHSSRASHPGQVGVPTSSHSPGAGASHLGQVGVLTTSRSFGASHAGQVVSSNSSGATPSGVIDQTLDKVQQVGLQQSGSLSDKQGRGGGRPEDVKGDAAKQIRGTDSNMASDENANVGRLGWTQASNAKAQDQGVRSVTLGPSGKVFSPNTGVAPEGNMNISRLGWTAVTNANAQDQGARGVTVAKGNAKDQGVRGLTQGVNGEGNAQDLGVRGVTQGAVGIGFSRDGGAASEENRNMGAHGWSQASAPDQGVRGLTQASNVVGSDQGLRGLTLGTGGVGLSASWNTPALSHGSTSYAYAPVTSAAGRDDANPQAWAQARVMSLSHQAEAKRNLSQVVQGFHPQSSQPKFQANLPQNLQPHLYAEYSNLVSRPPPQQSTGILNTSVFNPLTPDSQPAPFATKSGVLEQKGISNHQPMSNIRGVTLQPSTLQQRAMPPDLNVALLSPSALQSPSAQQGSTPTSARQPDLKLQL